MFPLTQYTTQIQQLCATHSVKSLYAFGSVLTDKFNNESDIDLIVDFSKIKVEDYADNYFDLKFQLQHILQRPIDLLEHQAIKNPYFIHAINQQKQVLYTQI